jgi:cytochrome P450
MISKATGVRPLAEEVRLEDPEFYLGDPFPVYDRLRREDPVFKYEPLSTWVVSTYEDARYVARNAEIFSSAHGIVLADARKYAEDASNVGAMLGEGELIAVTDPPRHRELRRIVAPPFAPSWMERLTPQIERCCDVLLDQVPAGETVEWVEAIAARLPILTACALLGLPSEDADQVRVWTDAVEAIGDPHSLDDVTDAQRKFESLDAYVTAKIEEKRRRPAGDVLSLLAEAERAHANVSLPNIVTMAQALIAGGNDTTRALIAGIVALLAERPDQLAALAADPSLSASTVEEVLRWVSPARGFLRTATADTELRGKTIRKGDHVYFLIESANRDPGAFTAADRFDITVRRDHPPIAFGHGPHTCIAAPLVRVEAKAFIERLVARFPTWQLAGAPKRTYSVLRSSWTELPVRFSPR